METNRHGIGADDSVLKTFALLVGILLLLVGLGILAHGLAVQRLAPRVFFLSRDMMGMSIALTVGAVLAYWGVRRPRPNYASAEEALSNLIRKYEREGKTKELADARERLIQLLIEKDEQGLKEPRG